MEDFISLVNNILEEQNISPEDLFINNVVSKNTFYKYRHRNPNLETAIKIANYLHVSLDYLLGLSEDNIFHTYSLNQQNFYNTLVNLIQASNISQRQFCKELNYSKDNILRYKKGVQPSIRTLIEISKYFGCTIDELLTKQ